MSPESAKGASTACEGDVEEMEKSLACGLVRCQLVKNKHKGGHGAQLGRHLLWLNFCCYNQAPDKKHRGRVKARTQDS